MKPAIAILGAGPSGLTLARMLEMNNIEYTVFERDQSATNIGQGGTLDIRTKGGQEALKECGLFDKFKSLARYDGQAMKAVDRQGNVLWNKKPDGREDMPEIDRKELRRLLLESVPTEKIHWDARVESVNRGPDGSMEISLASGVVEKGFQLVVGADGAWSKARNMLTSAKPQYSGVSYLNTTISTSNLHYTTLSTRIGRGSFMALSLGKLIIAQRMGDGSYNVYAGLQIPENWSKENADLLQSPEFREQLVKNEYADWSPEITDIVKYSDGAFHTWPLYALSSDSLSWKPTPGCTLIGDAAHVGLPNGEGVNCAMHDSLQLVQQIVQCGVNNLDEAVRKYEEEMMPKGVEHIKDGEEMTTMFFEQDSPKSFKQWLVDMGQVAE